MIHISKIKQTPEDKWREMISIRKAITDSGVMYYLMDENPNFIPFVKDYLNVIQARAVQQVAPKIVQTYCYQLWYFIVFLKNKRLDILDLDGKPQILTDFKLWLKNPYRFYENVESFDFEDEYNDIKTTYINAIIDRVSSLFLWLKASGKIKDNPVVYRSVMRTSAMKDKDMLAHTEKSQTVMKKILKSKVPQGIPKMISRNVNLL